MKKILLTFCLLSGFVFTSFAQDKEKNGDGESQHHVRIDGKDTKVTVNVNGERVDLEEYLHGLGNRIEARVQEATKDNHVNIDVDDDNRTKIDIEFGFTEAIEAFAETIAEGVEEAVKHMDVEIKDIDPEDLKGSDVQMKGEDINDILDQIENRYGSEVENIDRMLIKIRDGYVIIEMDATLENGKKIEGFKEVFDDED